MASTPLERAFRHDRVVVLSAIAAVSALAWAYVIWLASEMNMSGRGMNMPGMMAPGFEPWHAADFFLMWMMWAVMMVGMMLPSVAPMVLIYAGVARHAHGKGSLLPLRDGSLRDISCPGRPSLFSPPQPNGGWNGPPSSCQ